MTANSYMKHVLEYKKKHPNISHIDAMKKAKDSYKPTGKNDTKTKPTKNRSREKLTKAYTKSFGNLLYMLNDNKYDQQELDNFTQLTEKLQGNSTKNRYARNIKKIDKLIKRAKPIKTTTDEILATKKSDRQNLIEDASRSRERDDTRFDKIRLQLDKQGMSSRDIDNYIEMEKEKSKLIKADFERTQDEAKNTRSKKIRCTYQ